MTHHPKTPLRHAASAAFMATLSIICWYLAYVSAYGEVESAARTVFWCATAYLGFSEAERRRAAGLAARAALDAREAA